MNNDIEKNLEEYPDKVANALSEWRLATLLREKEEALLYIQFKVRDRTATEIRALINSSDQRYDAVMKEIKAESEYNRLNEKLLATKKLAALRTAF